MSYRVTHVIKDVHHIEAERDDGKLLLKVYGETTTGSYVLFKIRFQFWWVSHLVNAIAKVWKNERQSRMAEISNVDESLKGADQQ